MELTPNPTSGFRLLHKRHRCSDSPLASSHGPRMSAWERCASTRAWGYSKSRHEARPGIASIPREATSRLRFIRRAKAVGFSLREIRELRELRASKQNANSAREVAESRIAEIDTRLAELKETRRLLKRLTTKCDGKGSVRAGTTYRPSTLPTAAGPGQWGPY